jgi:hypothetical protein
MSGPRSEAAKAILAYIRANQPVTQARLNEHFRPQAAAVGMSAPSWLHVRLTNMRNADFISHGPAGWVAVQRTASCDEVNQKPRKRKATEVAETSIAQPRRISMFGEPYRPAPQVLREGALDYADAPSLINGQTRAYRSAW